MVKANSMDELKSAVKGSGAKIKGENSSEEDPVKSESTNKGSTSSVEQHERKQQKHVATWIDSKLPDLLWTHVPNEIWGNTAIEGKMRKDCGTSSGVPDIMIFDSVDIYEGVAIELKRPDARTSDVSDSQHEWLDGLQERGWYVAIAFGADEAVEILTDLFLSDEK